MSLFSIEGMQIASLYRIESVSIRPREERDLKAEHGKPRQTKASLAMSRLALPGESILSMERITRLISSTERKRERARHRQGQGKGKGEANQGRTRQALLYI